eukprot:superscaffoldBa00006363_g21441
MTAATHQHSERYKRPRCVPYTWSWRAALPQKIKQTLSDSVSNYIFRGVEREKIHVLDAQFRVSRFVFLRKTLKKSLPRYPGRRPRWDQIKERCVTVLMQMKGDVTVI